MESIGVIEAALSVQADEPVTTTNANVDAVPSTKRAPSFNGPYPPAADAPTQAGAAGLRFDFNDGCRVLLPSREHGAWRARLRDLDTGNILFETETKGGLIRSAKRWRIRFKIEIWDLSDDDERLTFSHTFDAADREVLIQFPVGTLGDSIAWYSYACRFADHHPGARVTCAMAAPLIPLFEGAYPDIAFVTPDEVVTRRLNETAYATYNLGLFFNDAACERQPTDFRHVGLHKTAAYILGVDLEEQAPQLARAAESRPIQDRYVVIAVQATSAAKMWNNPNGWREVVAHLKQRGYRVVCIDQKPVHGEGIYWNHIPHGAEDETGQPLADCARWLRHADLFVGLSSGLSWLAWAARCPTVLISGFSHPTTEFATPGRIINWHTCNSCWNDTAFTFDHKNFLWCPRHAGTARHFECTRLITPTQVIRAIDRTLSPTGA